MKRAILIGVFIVLVDLATLLLSGCAHAKPQTTADPSPDPAEWVLSNEAKDSDTICSQTWDDGPYKHCRSVGEVRAFLRALRAD